jgi:hypothetical protein
VGNSWLETSPQGLLSPLAWHQLGNLARAPKHSGRPAAAVKICALKQPGCVGTFPVAGTAEATAIPPARPPTAPLVLTSSETQISWLTRRAASAGGAPRRQTPVEHYRALAQVKATRSAPPAGQEPPPSARRPSPPDSRLPPLEPPIPRRRRETCTQSPSHLYRGIPDHFQAHQGAAHGPDWPPKHISGSQESVSAPSQQGRTSRTGPGALRNNHRSCCQLSALLPAKPVQPLSPHSPHLNWPYSPPSPLEDF